MSCFSTAFALVVVAVGGAISPAMFAADWPQFQGPERSGISPETGLARSWPEGGPKVLWTVDVGEGFAAAAIRDGKVHVLDRSPNGKDVLRCLDLGTGQEEWTCAYDAPGKLQYPGSRQVPTVDEKLIFAMGPFGNFNCIDRATHQIVWSHHMVNDFKDPAVDNAADDPTDRAALLARTRVPTWGFTQAPALYKDTVIVAPQTRNVGLVAYEKTTGKLRWTSPYVGRNWYDHVSPYVTTLCGVDQVIMIGQPGDPEKWPPAIISGVDAGTGKMLWQMRTWHSYKIPISSPVRIGEDRLFVSGAYGIGCFMLKIGREAGRWTTDYVFKDNKNSAAQIQNPIYYRDDIYVQSCNEPGAGNNGLTCLDTSGEIKWRTGPKQVFGSGGLLIADGLIYVMDGNTGELNLFEARPDECRQLATARVLAAEGRLVWAPLALSDGKLVVRDQHQMKCLLVK
ncbi:MAG: PQQ-binding-like beta-propeller repeat protein [Tepidisphaeraceae bacterium]